MKKYRCDIHNYGTNKLIEGTVPYCKYCAGVDKEQGTHKEKPDIIAYIALLWMFGHLVWLFLYMNPFS